MMLNDEQFVLMSPEDATNLLDMSQRTEPISLDEAIQQLHLISVLARAEDADR